MGIAAIQARTGAGTFLRCSALGSHEAATESAANPVTRSVTPLYEVLMILKGR